MRGAFPSLWLRPGLCVAVVGLQRLVRPHHPISQLVIVVVSEE